MEQFKYVSELISAMLVRLANNFNHIYVYTTPGNHSRISPKKEDSLDGENMDVLLPFYLKARLQNVDNVSICDNTIEPEIAMFNIRGNNVFSAHGHKDSPANVVQNFTMMFGKSVMIVDDIHYNEEMERAWREICEDERVTSTMDLYQMGLVFFDKNYWRKNYKIRL